MTKRVQELEMNLFVREKPSVQTVKYAVLLTDSPFMQQRIMIKSRQDIKAKCTREIVVALSYLISTENLKQWAMMTEYKVCVG